MSNSTCPCAPVSLDFEHFLREYPWFVLTVLGIMVVLFVLCTGAFCSCCWYWARAIMQKPSPKCRHCGRTKGKGAKRVAMPPSTPSIPVSQERQYLCLSVEELCYQLDHKDKDIETLDQNRTNNQGQGKKKNKGGNNQSQDEKKNKNKNKGCNNNHGGGSCNPKWDGGPDSDK